MEPFEALEVALQSIERLRPVVAKIERHDPDLARQIRRAASSIVLNLAEGNRRVGRDRNHCFRLAAGSNEEVRAALRLAGAWGSLDSHDSTAALELLDRVAAMLFRLGARVV